MRPEGLIVCVWHVSFCHALRPQFTFEIIDQKPDIGADLLFMRVDRPNTVLLFFEVLKNRDQATIFEMFPDIIIGQLYQTNAFKGHIKQGPATIAIQTASNLQISDFLIFLKAPEIQRSHQAIVPLQIKEILRFARSWDPLSPSFTKSACLCFTVRRSLRGLCNCDNGA